MPKVVQSLNENANISRKNQEGIINRINTNKTLLFIKCHRCLKYFISKQIFTKHMKIKHNIYYYPPKRGVWYNTKCELCGKHFNNVRLYNWHLRNHNFISMQKEKKKVKLKLVSKRKEKL